MEQGPTLEIDIACVGLGPAGAGFLATLTPLLAQTNPDGSWKFPSPSNPGMPLQVACYERADDIGLGVSGVATKGKYLSSILKDEHLKNAASLLTPITSEQLVYLTDPHKASLRPWYVKMADQFLNLLGKNYGWRFPWQPPSMTKEGGFTFSLGQLISALGQDIMAQGTVQLWPSCPVDDFIMEDGKVAGIKLVNQGVDRQGNPTANFLPGTQVKAALTVLADGPYGNLGQRADELFGLEEGSAPTPDNWAIGMKGVYDLDPQVVTDLNLRPGFVLHTLGYPELEVFGFIYVFAPHTACAGIMVSSTMEHPIRTVYPYWQTWLQHPRIAPLLKNAHLRSWGAKSLPENSLRFRPKLAGPGYVRLGESASLTNVATSSGVDEAWCSGVLLAKSLIQHLEQNKDLASFSAQWPSILKAHPIYQNSFKTREAREGFKASFVAGMIHMALVGMSNGKLKLPKCILKLLKDKKLSLQDYLPHLSASELSTLIQNAKNTQTFLHDEVLQKRGWPKINYDGQNMISQQDILLIGGKVQAAEGYADHIQIKDPARCQNCYPQKCVEICSGNALMPGGTPQPTFSREKCVFCGACRWTCDNIIFKAGSGGLHSNEN